MKTLDDAWQWYTDVKSSLKRLHRLANRYWDAIPWTQPPFLGDAKFVDLQREAVAYPALNAVNHLDDLAVVVLFSVFEDSVRQMILDQVEEVGDEGQHRVILDAIKKAKERIEVGSFSALLDPFKGIDDNLIEEVAQVRRYRNWVAHGKRKAQPPVVRPDIAYQRLKRCLTLLFRLFRIRGSKSVRIIFGRRKPNPTVDKQSTGIRQKSSYRKWCEREEFAYDGGSELVA